MGKLNEAALTFVVNATWQIVLLAAVASLLARLLADAPARRRHALWAASLALGSALPFLSLFDFPRLKVLTPQPTSQTGRPVEPQPAATFRIAWPDSTGASDAEFERDAATKPPLRSRERTTINLPPASAVFGVAYALFLLYRLNALRRSWARTRRIRSSARARALPPALVEVAARCRSAFRLGDVPLLCSAEIETPVTVGWRRPVVILPESFFEETSRETLTSVLGHELAHVARRDFALNLVCEFLHLPISFHPLAAWQRRQIARAREVACDELVTSRVLAPEAYARALVRVANAVGARHARRAHALGVFDADIFEERLTRLVRARRRARGGRLLTLAAASLLAATSLVASAFSLTLRPGVEPTTAAATAGGQTTAGLFAPEGRAPATATPDGAAAATHGASNSAAEGERANGGPKPPAQAGAASDAEQHVVASDSERHEASKASGSGGTQGDALGSSDPNERARAICALGKSGSAEAIPTLVRLLGDDAPAQPQKCWTNAPWTPAHQTFKQPSPGEEAALALASLGAHAVGPLTAALDNANPVVRRNAAWALGEIRGGLLVNRSEAVPALVRVLGDRDEWVRKAAAGALGEIRDVRGVEPLTAALADASTAVRRRAAWALGEMKERRAVAALSSLLLQDAETSVRQMAAWALGEIADPQGTTPLALALNNDSDERVRDVARWALGEIRD